MFTVLIVEKTGVIKEISLKSFTESDLYKKAGFKTDAGFKCMHQWTVKIDSTDKTNESDKSNTTISLYGKTSGRAGQENKYDFPPPVDNTLFFGACLLVADISNDKTTCGSLSTAKWNSIYEALFGGFEDIGDEDSEASEEDDIDVDTPLTKNGYVKDGFVVDDESYDSEEEESVEYETEEEEDDAESLPPPPKVNKVAKKNLKSQKTKSTVFDKIDTMVLTPENEPAFLDCTSELVEEAYEE